MKALANGAVYGLAVGVAGPALLWAGWKYPGSLQARLFLMATGVVLVGTQLPYLKGEAKKLLPG